MSRVDRTLALAVTLLAGLSAGFFVTWEISVVRGLARLDDPGYVSAMNAFNDTVRTPWFATVYFGTAVLAVLALAVRIRRVDRSTALLAVGALIYVGGVIALTAMVNLPLNAELGRTRSADPALAAAARAAYEGPWRNANLVRVMASCAAFALFAFRVPGPLPAKRDLSRR